MCDQRFEDRLKRIEVRAGNGAKGELLAGVDETRGPVKARSVAALPAKRSASPGLILLGVLAGYCSFNVLRSFDAPDVLVSLPPEDVLNLVRADPLAAAAAAMLLFSAVFSLASLLRGRQAVRMMSFSCASMGAALGSVIPTLT